MKNENLPSFVGIGAAKAGTTWLTRHLARHPEIYVPPRKELNSFDYHEFDAHCIEGYKRHFQCAGDARIKGEFSTIYLQSRRAPPRIRELLPNVKLLVSLRNPIEQVYSHYWHLRRQNFHQGSGASASMTVEQAMDEYPDLLVEPALYFKHLSRWREHFPERQIHTMFFDDIVRTPASVLESVWSFLEVECLDYSPSDHEEISTRERRGVSPKAKTYDDLHRALYGLLVRHVYNPMKVVLGPRRAAAVKDGLRARQVLEAAFFREGYPAMDSSLREMLREKFDDEISSLSGMTGRDLSHWR